MKKIPTVEYQENIIDSIITYINEWRSEMEFIPPEFTDKDYGPIRN